MLNGLADRTMVDVDILIDRSNFDRAKALRAGRMSASQRLCRRPPWMSLEVAATTSNKNYSSTTVR